MWVFGLGVWSGGLVGVCKLAMGACVWRLCKSTMDERLTYRCNLRFYGCKYPSFYLNLAGHSPAVTRNGCRQTLALQILKTIFRSELESPDEACLTCVILSAFLTSYAQFSFLVRNRLHLSESPLSLAVRIMFGTKHVGVLSPTKWNLHDASMQGITHIVLCVQVFVVGIELPTEYLEFMQATKH